eukprot:Blabericola_migrator_1__8076@NODE_4157_length_1303_cov_150_710356_g497_i3_p1_GENE_NODE_4157_length_1303_cov_150_710356_g497_i3NODE_4157_length_1303_cov_150_710356_g497_i3_p1_ORF_typecomplete_len317_score44_56_NODE_4157_length_1303_cov_150_710356_g497_i3831033
MYRPEAIVLKILSVQDVVKKEGYVVEVEFNGERGVAKPSPGALALFFKDHQFTFPFKQRGTVNFKLHKIGSSGQREPVATADFNLSALMGNMDSEILRSVGMKWHPDSAFKNQSVKPLLSFSLMVTPPPPRGLKESVWGDLYEEDFPDLYTSHPELPLFTHPESANTGQSLWLDMQAPSVYGAGTTRPPPPDHNARAVPEERPPRHPAIGGHPLYASPREQYYGQTERRHSPGYTQAGYHQRVNIQPPVKMESTRSSSKRDDESFISKGVRYAAATAEAAKTMFGRSKTEVLSTRDRVTHSNHTYDSGEGENRSIG